MSSTVRAESFPSNTFNSPMQDFFTKNLQSTMSMPFTFTKKPGQIGSYPEARHFWDYEILNQETVFAEMQAANHFLNATINVDGKQYQISPVINYFTLSKYLILENDLDVGEIIIPGFLHKKLSIEIYGQGVWQIKRSQARYKISATKTGHYELVPPQEIDHENPLLSALFLFLSELLAWESNRL